MTRKRRLSLYEPIPPPIAERALAISIRLNEILLQVLMTQDANTRYSASLTGWEEADRVVEDHLIIFIRNPTTDNEKRLRDAFAAERSLHSGMLAAYLRLVRETVYTNQLDDLDIVKALMDKMKDLEELIEKGFSKTSDRIDLLTKERREAGQQLQDQITELQQGR